MRLAGYSDRGLTSGQADQEDIRHQVADVRAVQATLDPANGSCDHRHVQFQTLREQFQGSDEPRRQHMGRVLASFEPGLFVRGDDAELPQDNLDLERWFRHPKGHERRIHGHRHAGVRLVHEGPTLLAALDAHVAHPGQFTGADLRPYWRVPAPACQRQAMHRRTIMRQARSKQNRAMLLVNLERRYLESS
jgi:hypothetical protein